MQAKTGPAVPAPTAAYGILLNTWLAVTMYACILKSILKIIVIDY